jgi:hypothetical protein
MSRDDVQMEVRNVLTGSIARVLPEADPVRTDRDSEGMRQTFGSRGHFNQLRLPDSPDIFNVPTRDDYDVSPHGRRLAQERDNAVVAKDDLLVAVASDDFAECARSRHARTSLGQGGARLSLSGRKATSPTAGDPFWPETLPTRFAQVTLNAASRRVTLSRGRREECRLVWRLMSS